MKDKYLVHEFSRLTKITVRALHFYDRIGLLPPADRTPGGARLYTDKDLVRLQQILTLKFMGFRLKQIKSLLDRPGYSVKKTLKVQAQAVDEEIGRLKKAARALRESIGLLEADRKLEWKKILRIMEAIRMSEEIKAKWAEKFFTEEELKQFEEAGKRFTPAQMEAYQKKWADLLVEIEANLTADPAGPKGQDLARRWLDLMKTMDAAYGNWPNLKGRISEAYQTGQVPQGYGPSPRVWEFVQKAIAAREKK
jgi:DNA-binding transcriptional MerR regulator